MVNAVHDSINLYINTWDLLELHVGLAQAELKISETTVSHTQHLANLTLKCLRCRKGDQLLDASCCLDSRGSYRPLQEAI
jgi:hypothetical protein